MNAIKMLYKQNKNIVKTINAESNPLEINNGLRPFKILDEKNTWVKTGERKGVMSGCFKFFIMSCMIPDI